MQKPLEGKTSVITGASSGIGEATARTLAAQGAAVVLSARRGELLQKLAEEIEAAGGKALAVAGDVSQPEEVDRLLEAAQYWAAGGKKYDIVVANAGRGLAGGLLGSDEAQWQELIQLNVLGLAHLLRRAGRYFVERKTGDIVAIGSVVGRNISPYSGFYGASKFAVAGLVEALRREVCSSGVRVSLVMPGIVVSGFQQVAGYNEENFGKSVAAYGELLEPQPIADGIVWLLGQPPHVNVSELMIRPTGQNYP